MILTIVSDPFKDIFNQLTDSFSLSMLFFSIVLMLITGMDYSLISGPLHYPLLDFSVIIYIVLFGIILYAIAAVIKWINNHRKCLK